MSNGHPTKIESIRSFLKVAFGKLLSVIRLHRLGHRVLDSVDDVDPEAFVMARSGFIVAAAKARDLDALSYEKGKFLAVMDSVPFMRHYFRALEALVEGDLKTYEREKRIFDAFNVSRELTAFIRLP